MKKIIGICIVLLLLCIVVVHPGNSIRNLSLGENEKMSTGNRYHYYTYDEMTDLLQNLQQNHSDILSFESIGTTYEGRDIWMVKISDNVTVNEDEPEVLFMGAHHGDEKISYEVLLYFINYVTDMYDKKPIDNDGDAYVDKDLSEVRIRNMIDSTEIVIVPMVNPDGVEKNTRKNCEPNYGDYGESPTITSIGVNINRNYGYKWELFTEDPSKYDGATSQDNTHFNYRGEKPFSENETRAIRELVNASDFVISLSYHSCLGAVIYPWGYTEEINPDNELFFSIARNISRINKFGLYTFFTFPFFGSEYVYNLGHRFLGYPVGMSDDWLYGEHNILAFTIELGTLIWWTSSLIFDYFNVYHNMTLHNLGKAPVNPHLVLDSCKNTIHTALYVCEISSDIQNLH